MIAQSENIQSIKFFGDGLIRAGDLDPLYIAIHDAGLPEPQMAKLLFAYWCFYHFGVACWLSEQSDSDYWKWMTTAAHNKTSPPVASATWPRLSARRHFRGQKCVDAIEWFAGKFRSPADTVRRVSDFPCADLAIRAVMEWPMFGQNLAWKAADMTVCCYGARIEFDEGLEHVSKQPIKSLEVLAADHPRDQVYRYLLSYFGQWKAPPRADRPCGPQEVETILCKWKHYLEGHYYVGKDIAGDHRELSGWGETAAKMIEYLPPMVINGSH